MKPTHSPDRTDFEQQARRLLERYAEDMPTETSVEARVRAQLAAPEPQRHTARERTAPRWALDGWARGAVSLALVIVLVAGFVAVLRTHGGAQSVGKVGGSSATCATVTSEYAIALCPGSHIQAQVIVGQTYADPTRTALQLRLSLTGADLQIGGAAPKEADAAEFHGMTIQDSQGNIYAANDMTTPINFAHGPYVDVFGAAEFDPLPESLLSSPQTLTLRIQQIVLSYFVGGAEMVLLVNGPWTTQAHLTPQVGHSIAFDVAPETVGGVTIQPLRLDVGPSGIPFDDLNGGARLVVRISGLSPDIRRSAVAHVSFQYFSNDGSGASMSGASRLLFGGKEPASIAGDNPNVPSSLDPVVGPTGTIELEFIFLSPAMPKLSGTQSLTLNQITVSTNPTEKVVQGNWSFQLPLG